MKRSIGIPALYVIRLLIFCFYLKPRLWRSYKLCCRDTPAVMRMPLYYPMVMRTAVRKKSEKNLLPSINGNEDGIWPSILKITLHYPMVIRTMFFQNTQKKLCFVRGHPSDVSRRNLRFQQPSPGCRKNSFRRNRSSHCSMDTSLLFGPGFP